jgi:hypothetical protein
MTMNKQDILDNLQAFVNQRPGLEPANYAGHADLYRRDYREHCHKPKQDFEALARAVDLRLGGITTDDMRQGFRRAFGGRLDLHEDGSLEYTPGQYGATEYRRAACDVLARILWDFWASDTPEGKTPREHITRNARREFGRGIAARWFD